jgi:hypothetical protein
MTYPAPVKDGRRLGFWQAHPCEYGSFDYVKYFNTPPFPAFMEYCATDYEKWSTSIMQSPTSPFITMLKYADANKNIKIAVMLGGLDLTSPTKINSLKTFCSLMKSHRSISSIGVETEYASFLLTDKNNWTTLRDVINSYGFPFVSYRPDKGQPFMSATEGMYYMGHTNYPIQDPETTLDNYQDPAAVGLSSGYWGYPNELSYWTSFVTSNIIAHTVAHTVNCRLYTALCLKEWDNASLRSWIWTDPNYQKNFILSTAITPTPPTPTPISVTGTLIGAGVVLSIVGLLYLASKD